MRCNRAFMTMMLVLMISGEAGAVIFGIRYSNLNEPILPAIDRPDNRGRFGIYMGKREKNSDFLIGLEYDSYKQERGDTLIYSRRISFNIGYRYQMFPAAKAEAMDIMPFIGIFYYRSFGKVDSHDSLMSSEERQYYKDITSDQGGWLSFGAEYYFAPAFSMGCEGGIRYTRIRSNAYGYTIKISEYTTFAAILLGFYWR